MNKEEYQDQAEIMINSTVEDIMKFSQAIIDEYTAGRLTKRYKLLGEDLLAVIKLHKASELIQS